MKISFTNFLSRNLALFRLAVITSLEYRLNYLIDALVQPIINACIEMTLWLAVFAAVESSTVAGFDRTHYLSYALWAAFTSRIAANWMYEYRMTEEIISGSVNSLLVRPVNFFEFYLAQFVGYKMTTTFVSFIIPVIVCLSFKMDFHWQRLPLVLVMICYYILFTHILSVGIASCSFFLNRVYSLTAVKNFLIWFLSGELFPLDLAPEPFRTILVHSPFASAVYIPVGYLTGRFGIEMYQQGLLNITYGILIVSPLTYGLWKLGVRRYVGTGA